MSKQTCSIEKVLQHVLQQVLLLQLIPALLHLQPAELPTHPQQQQTAFAQRKMHAEARADDQ